MALELASLLKVDFRLLLPSTKTRRVQAAIAAIASRIAVSRIDADQLAMLDAEVIRIYRPFGLYPWWNLRANRIDPDRKACAHAVAMWHLDMATGIPDKSWGDLLHLWHQRSPTQLIQDFRPFHKDTDVALAWLAGNGVQVPASFHYGHRWLAQARTNSG